MPMTCAERAGFPTRGPRPDQDRATVIGCVYGYPSGRAGHDADAAWVRAADAHLDAALASRAVSDRLDRGLAVSSATMYAIRPDAMSPTLP